MQSGVDWNRTETSGPAGEHHFQELGAVLHAQHDAVAGFETAGGETAREDGDAASELAIAPSMATVTDRPSLGLPAGNIKQQRCEVHTDPPPAMINNTSS